MEKELINRINELITEQGLKISGNGIIIENLNKLAQILEKIDKKLYFAEKRQEEMFKWMKEKG